MVSSLKVVDGISKEVSLLNLKRVFCSMKCLASGKIIFCETPSHYFYLGLNLFDSTKEKKRQLTKLLFIKLLKEEVLYPQQDIQPTSSFTWT